ncbi:MAG: nucleotidyl transferase AbiEii/AbiGii toxin family protein [Thermovirgaceae bacterium]|nr:nucleotidyl transferase AbiEii/AbiGii toxin family protein [Thermovirgaceae bacterium]
MNEPDPAPVRHHDDPELFRAALAYTVAETGFAARLIEKDYFCTVLLSYLATLNTEIVFKGGTCLAKVHADFYRMSEDLDFVISSSCDASRKERSSRVVNLKKGIQELPGLLPVFRVDQPLRGANASTQYLAEIGYTSLNTGELETIKLEVSLSEPLLTPVAVAPALTILLNPITAKPSVAPVTITCLSLLESFAEKFRAALSRRDPAIRDFFDIDYAERRLGINARKPGLVGLVREKMAIPGNEPADVSSARLDTLRRQVESQLKSVLRERDFEEFDLDRSFATVREMARSIANEAL